MISYKKSVSLIWQTISVSNLTKMVSILAFPLEEFRRVELNEGEQSYKRDYDNKYFQKI